MKKTKQKQKEKEKQKQCVKQDSSRVVVSSRNSHPHHVFQLKARFCTVLGFDCGVFAPRQLSTSRAVEKLRETPNDTQEQRKKKTYTESREKSRSRLLPQTAVARDLCAIFGLCCTLHVAQTGQTFVANTHAHSLIIANSIAVKYFAKIAKFDIHRHFYLLHIKNAMANARFKQRLCECTLNSWIIQLLIDWVKSKLDLMWDHWNI